MVPEGLVVALLVFIDLGVAGFDALVLDFAEPGVRLQELPVVAGSVA